MRVRDWDHRDLLTLCICVAICIAMVLGAVTFITTYNRQLRLREAELKLQEAKVVQEHKTSRTNDRMEVIPWHKRDK